MTDYEKGLIKWVIFILILAIGSLVILIKNIP